MIIAQATHRLTPKSNMSLGLLGAYISSSSDSETDNSDEETSSRGEVSTKPAVTLQNPFNDPQTAKVQLPKPSFMQEQEEKIQGCTTSAVENSVFKNPFREAENQKRAVLERHVAMTTRPEEKREINGKKVCWNFRKGRCRFGSNCKFAHDNDVVAKNSTLAAGTTTCGQTSQGFTTKGDEEQGEGVIAESNKRAKKRPGLSAGLELSKKALKFHQRVYDTQ